MSKPFVISIPHRLGKDEAIRRLKSGLGNVRTSYSHLFSVQEEVWTDDRLQFRVAALGQTANGTIEVTQDYVNLEVFLPWLLAQLAEMIQPLVRKEGMQLLEKK
jgi:Putative polyhydroxyalkanoic acid system protein (PHA_gran_rgn)